MAKRGEGTPYMVQAAMAGPDTVRQDIIQKAFLSVSLDISKVINSYSSFDWPIVAAALSIAGPALKADLNPEGQELVDDFLTDAQAIHYKTPKRGGVSKTAPFPAPFPAPS